MKINREKSELCKQLEDAKADPWRILFVTLILTLASLVSYGTAFADSSWPGGASDPEPASCLVCLELDSLKELAKPCSDREPCEDGEACHQMPDGAGSRCVPAILKCSGNATCPGGRACDFRFPEGPDGTNNFWQSGLCPCVDSPIKKNGGLQTQQSGDPDTGINENHCLGCEKANLQGRRACDGRGQCGSDAECRQVPGTDDFACFPTTLKECSPGSLSDCDAGKTCRASISLDRDHFSQPGVCLCDESDEGREIPGGF